MNILYICADAGIPIRGHKGASIHVRALSEAFQRLGHKVTIVSPRPGPADGPQVESRMVEVTLPRNSENSTPEEREKYSQEAANQVYLAAKELFSREHFDFIYERYSLWSHAGARLATEAQIPMVVEFNAPLREEAARYRSLTNTTLAETIEKRMLEEASVIVAVSEPLKAYLLNQGAAVKKIQVIPNGVDERFFHPAVKGKPVRNRLGLEEKFVIGFVGTSRPWHDIETLIQAVEFLKSEQTGPDETKSSESKPYHLLLVGEFPEQVRASLKSHNLEDFSTVIDAVSNRDVPAYLAAMDAAMSPHPVLDGFYFSPLKLFEYMACGIATVAADVPPVAEIIQHSKNGMLYSPGNSEDLAAQIHALACDPAIREKLGMQGARDILTNHTWNGNAQKILKLIGPSLPNVAEAQAMPVDGSPAPLWDEKMGRALFAATRIDLANEKMAQILGREGLGQITNWKILQQRPGRRYVIAYETDRRLKSGDSIQFVGKIYHNHEGLNQFNLQTELWAKGFAADAADHITVTKPYGYLHEMRTFAQEFVPGKALENFTGQAGFEEKIKACGRTIAKLHQSGIEPRKVYPLSAELTNLNHWTAELQILKPGLADRFKRQLRELHELAQAIPATEAAPIHRDFHYGQILFSEARITLIDLDLLAIGDPAIDIGNFAAHIQFLGMQQSRDPETYARLSKSFVKEYLAQNPLQDSGARVGFYEAATFFRLMYLALTRPLFNTYFGSLLLLCDQKIKQAMEVFYEQTQNQIS